jgi:GT2 family glycosyltransferase
VTVGVITYNSEPVLEKYFEGLSKAGYPFDLIVVDNKSRSQPDLWSKLNDLYDKYLEKAEFKTDIQIIFNPNNAMYTKAANQILDASRRDVTLLMNPDCFGMDEGWLKRMVDMHEKHQADVTGYKLVKQDTNLIEHVGGKAPGIHLGKNEEDKGQYDEPYVLGEDDQYVTGACWMIPRKTVEKFGKLDNKHVHYASDREYCFTVRRGGGTVMYHPVRMIHLFGRSSY